MTRFTFSPKGIDLLKQTTVVLTILLLTFVVGMSFSLTQYNFLVFFAALLTLLGVAWLFYGQHARIPLKPFILIWLAVYTTSVILSIDPRRSLNQMFLMLVGVFLFLLSYDLNSRGWSIIWFLKAYFLVGLIVITLSLKEAGSWYLHWLQANPGNWLPDISYRLGTANLMPPFLFLSFHIGAVLLIRSTKKIARIGIAIIMFLSLVVLYLTSSRGGWLGMFFGLVVWGIYFSVTSKEFIRKWFTNILTNKALFIVLLLLALGLITFAGYILYKQAIHPTHGNIFTSRTNLWGPAFAAFRQHPLFGQGTFTYGTSFLIWNSVPPDSVYPHAHSIYINLLGEMGIVGIVAAILFFIPYFLLFRKTFQQSKDHLILISILAIIISAAGHNLFDAYHTKPAMLWPLAILAGAAIAPQAVQTSHSAQISKSRPWGVLFLIGFAWLGIWAITPYYQAVELANQEKWQPAYDLFQRAVKRDPRNALTHQQLALTAAVLAQNHPEPYLQVAIQELETTIRNEPGWALNHANLAALYFQNNQVEKALQSAESSVRLAPKVAFYWLNAGILYEQSNANTQAQAAYQQALTLSPAWAAYNFWNETAVRKETLTHWQAGHLQPEPITSSETLRFFEANKQYSWAYNGLAEAYLVMGELPSARQSLENAGLAYVNTNSDLLTTQWLWAEYYAASGENEKAIVLGVNAIQRYSLYGVFGPGTFGNLQYAPNLFRMSAMAIEIVPQMSSPLMPQIWQERANLLKSWQEKVQ